ncbi:hypothetical protein M23134_03541 [Microscilla marina ATCC 23134]|uniref:Uncharacterized protein n=1 Tax=Microscilla marina ATCC 23134 TaxID=313606 RepID=A1ZN99_MICM2|nr:hypothetical protein M23134_03541 [Microscilla marina ATCC 23134]
MDAVLGGKSSKKNEKTANANDIKAASSKAGITDIKNSYQVASTPTSSGFESHHADNNTKVYIKVQDFDKLDESAGLFLEQIKGEGEVFPKEVTVDLTDTSRLRNLPGSSLAFSKPEREGLPSTGSYGVGSEEYSTILKDNVIGKAMKSARKKAEEKRLIKEIKVDEEKITFVMESESEQVDRQKFEAGWVDARKKEISGVKKKGISVQEEAKAEFIEEFIDYLNAPESTFSLKERVKWKDVKGEEEERQGFKKDAWNKVQESMNATVIYRKTGSKLFPGGQGHPALDNKTPDYFIGIPDPSEGPAIADAVSLNVPERGNKKVIKTDDIRKAIESKVRKYTTSAGEQAIAVSVVVNLSGGTEDNMKDVKKAISRLEVKLVGGKTAKPAQVFLVTGNEVEVVDFQSEGAEGSSPPVTEEA